MAYSSEGNGVRGVITTTSACVIRFQIHSSQIRYIEHGQKYRDSSPCLDMRLRVDPSAEVPDLPTGDWICQIWLAMWRFGKGNSKVMGFSGYTDVVPPEGLIAHRPDVVHFSVTGQQISAKGSAGFNTCKAWVSRALETRRGLVAVDDVIQINNARIAWTYIIRPNETINVEFVFPITPAERTGVKDEPLPVQLWDGQPANRNTDCVLISGDGHRFPCYRSILAARSTVFAAMFQDEKGNGECLVDVIDGGVLEILLEFLYTSQADTKRVKDVAEEVYKAAEKYAVPELCGACENIMIDNLSVKNALSYLTFAVPRGLQNLKTRTIQFMNSNIAEI